MLGYYLVTKHKRSVIDTFIGYPLLADHKSVKSDLQCKSAKNPIDF